MAATAGQRKRFEALASGPARRDEAPPAASVMTPAEHRDDLISAGLRRLTDDEFTALRTELLLRARGAFQMQQVEYGTHAAMVRNWACEHTYREMAHWLSSLRGEDELESVADDATGGA